MDGSVSDEILLQRAAQDRDRTAIDELIRRYANLVYGIALRQTGDPQAAADVSQAVFIVFIRRLGSIRSARVLPRWFFKTTQFAVQDARRSALRRRFHEQQAARPEQTDMNRPSADRDDPNVKLIDEAIASLSGSDRDLVLMRYMQGREYAAIAMDIGISEQTARKRLERAIERMRTFFAKRGAALEAGGVTSLLLAASACSAPAAVIEASTAAVAATAAAAVGTAGMTAGPPSIANGILQAMALYKLKVVACVAAVAVVAGGGAVALVQQQEQPQPNPPPQVAQLPPMPQLPATAPSRRGGAGRRGALPPPGAMSFEEAVEMMNAIYGLADGEMFRLVPPPYPPARDIWLQYGPGRIQQTQSITSITVRWTPQGLESYSYGSGGVGLWTILGGYKIKWYEVDGVEQLKWRPLDADLVVRDSVTQREKMDAVAALITQFTGKPVMLVPEQRTRPCIVIGGQLKPGLFRRPDGDAVFVALDPPDEKIKEQSQGRQMPSGFRMRSNLEQVGELLKAPIFDEVERRGLVNTYLVAPDVLDPSDPEYLGKLRRVLDVLRDQIGGEWRIENRTIETYVLDPYPGVHPAQVATERFIDAVIRKDAAAAAGVLDPKGAAKAEDIAGVLASNRNILNFIEIVADDSAAYVCTDYVQDDRGRQGRVVFHLNVIADQWRVNRVDFGGIPRTLFMADHPQAGMLKPVQRRPPSFGPKRS